MPYMLTCSYSGEGTITHNHILNRVVVRMLRTGGPVITEDTTPFREDQGGKCSAFPRLNAVTPGGLLFENAYTMKTAKLLAHPTITNPTAPVPPARST